MPTKTLNLRNMPEDLVRRAKAYAALNGVSLKAFVTRALEQALMTSGGPELRPGKKDKKDKKDKKRKKEKRVSQF